MGLGQAERHGGTLAEGIPPRSMTNSQGRARLNAWPQLHTAISHDTGHHEIVSQRRLLQSRERVQYRTQDVSDLALAARWFTVKNLRFKPTVANVWD